MKLGFAGYSWPGLYGQSLGLTLEAAADSGLEVMQILERTDVGGDDDARRLTEIRRVGESLGLGVEIGVNHFALVGDHAADAVGAKLDACLAAGFTEISTLTNLDRFDPAEPMSAQLGRLTRALDALVPRFAEHGAHLNLETHEDLTSDEVVRVVDQLDPAAIGVTLDVANFAVNAEDPVAATRRVASRVRQTHFEDIRLHLVPHGIRRLTCPVGQGVIDWSEIVSMLSLLDRPPTLCVELHRGQFDAAVFDPGWIARHPDLRTDELAGSLAGAVAGAEQRGELLDRGPWPTPYGAAEVPERIAAIQAGVAHLRTTLAQHG